RQLLPRQTQAEKRRESALTTARRRYAWTIGLLSSRIRGGSSSGAAQALFMSMGSSKRRTRRRAPCPTRDTLSSAFGRLALSASRIPAPPPITAAARIAPTSGLRRTRFTPLLSAVAVALA